MKKEIIKISGMTCAGCSSGLEKYLNKQEGIIKAEVNLVMSNASIEYDEKILNLDKIAELVKQAGFRSLGIDKFEEEKRLLKNDRVKLIITIVLGIVLMIISMSHMIGIDIPYVNIDDNPKIYGVVSAVLATSIIAMSITTIINGVRKIIHRMPNMDSLISIGVVTSYIYSMYSLIMTLCINTHHVHNIYFESLAMVIVFTKIGRYIDNNSKIKVKKAITSLMTITPAKATIIRDEYEIQVNIDEINKGEIVICKPGEKIAVDGVIVNGYTHIDESFITGESMPSDKKTGDKVLAGSINMDGYIEYRAEKIGKDSTISEIVKMVVEAVNSKTPIAKVADKICTYFVPIVILLAIISFIVWSIIGDSILDALNIFVSVLVVACPCALGLATPLATTIATNTSVKKGILIKKSEVLENINKIDTVVFDKTGTLTEGELKISEIYKYSDLSENGILQLVGTIERKSEHPIAKAIIRRCSKQGIKLGQVREIDILPGLGVKARYKGEEILIGSKKLMIKNNILVNEEDENNLYEKGNMVIFVAVNNKLVSTIGLKDNIKESAKLLIENLNKKNLEVIMLTGDNEKVANLIANEAGITNVIAGVMPNEKLNKIEELKKSGKKVMMIGDGINDAPSLVKADVSVSLDTATDIALDSSDIVIMNKDLTLINTLFDISKKSFRIIKQNLFWAFIYNIIMIPVAAGVLSKLGILLNPMYSAIAMTVSSILVIINSIRLKRF